MRNRRIARATASAVAATAVATASVVSVRVESEESRGAIAVFVSFVVHFDDVKKASKAGRCGPLFSSASGATLQEATMLAARLVVLLIALAACVLAEGAAERLGAMVATRLRSQSATPHQCKTSAPDYTCTEAGPDGSDPALRCADDSPYCVWFTPAGWPLPYCTSYSQPGWSTDPC